MKRKLHFLLAVGIGLVASVGWLHAEDETHHVFHVGTIANKTGDVQGLRDSIAKAANGDTIKLASVIYLLDEQLVINKGIVLEGIIGSPDATVIKANRDAEWPKKGGNIDNSKTNLISIEGGTKDKSVTLKNLAVFNSMASGINAQSVMTTYLDGVIIDGSMNAGLLVHSAVEVKSLKTLSNGWGSVNVDKGTPEYTPNFKFTDGNYIAREPYKIWTELTTDNSVVTVPDGSNWKTYSIKKYDASTKKWSEDKKYWTPSDLDLEYYSTFPKKPWTNGYNFVYAKGNAITIERSAEYPDFTAIKDNNGNVLVELPKQCHPVIIGGSKSTSVENTSITMNSGTVEMLIGGGYGLIDASSKAISGDTAKVTGKTTIVMTGGTVSGSLIGGGLYYNKTNKVDISLSGTASVGIPNNWVICGGFESGNTAGTQYDEFAKSTNTVAEATLNIDGGTYSLIGVGGTDGDKGYVQNATAIVKNATITGGVYGNGSNGRSDKVNGTFDNCTFTKTTNNPIEIAGVNRGRSKDITMTFKDCKFPENPKDIYTYLGGTYQWQTNYGGSKVGVPEKVSFIFEGGTNVPVVGISSGLDIADVTVTGAKASIDSVLVSVDGKTGKETWLKTFTLGADKTWTFNDGLSMVSGVTLTKTGTLEYGKSFDANVSTFAEMQTAVGMIKDGGGEKMTSVITIEKDLTFDGSTTLMGGSGDFQGLFYLKGSKMKNLALTIEGNGKSISGKKYTSDSDNDGSKKYLFYIEGNDNVSTMTINNLIMKDMDVVGINAYDFAGLIFNNVAMDNNLQGAVHLNSSVLKATNFTTSGNKKFAVKLSREKDNLPGIILNDGCKLGEYAKDAVPQIAYYDRYAYKDKFGTSTPLTPTAEQIKAMVSGIYGNTLSCSWAKATLHTSNNEAAARVWTSNLATEYVSNSATVQLDSISTGLDSLLIDQDFATVAGVMNTGVKYATFNGKELTASALRKGLVINCEDAYLVTDKGEAVEFANEAKNKTVKALTLADNKLAVVSAFSTQVIETEQSWNDAKYAEQNVIIKSNGILNINTAMALDTVFMEEGAQLKVLPNTAVTAKAVQLAYKVTDQWKAFGFPFNKMGDSKAMTVKDAKGTAVQTTANGTFGKDENGFWTATVKASEVGFTLTSSAATPDSACLIAASRADKADSLIYVTSPASVVVSLGTKEAPTSVDGLKSDGLTLKMCANPNLYEMQLSGYAYIFDAAKNVYTQQFNPTIAPFQSYILADATTTSTLRSLRVGDTPTGNEMIAPVEGYYVESGHGMITIRTAEPVQVVVADMLGRIHYNARVVSDGYQINLPAGIYAVNKQKVIVK